MTSVCFHNGIVLNGTYKFENGGVLVKDSVIVDVFNEARFTHKRFPPDTHFIDVRGAYIAPGFIDTHIHGTGGFGTDTVTDQNNDIIGMANGLAAMGVT